MTTRASECLLQHPEDFRDHISFPQQVLRCAHFGGSSVVWYGDECDGVIVCVNPHPRKIYTTRSSTIYPLWGSSVARWLGQAGWGDKERTREQKAGLLHAHWAHAVRQMKEDRDWLDKEQGPMAT